MTKRRWLLFAFAAVAPFLLILALPPSIALALQSPGLLAVNNLRLGDGIGGIVGVLVSWLSLALPIWLFGYMMTCKNRPAKVVAWMLLFGICAASIVLGPSQKQKTFVGTFEYGFEPSNFYPNGDCWRPPYWVSEMPMSPLMASEPAVSVKFIGDVSRIGSYGHLGAYVREVTVKKLLDVSTVGAM